MNPPAPPTGFDEAAKYRRKRREEEQRLRGGQAKEEQRVREELAVLVRAYVWYWHVEMCGKSLRHLDDYYPQVTFCGVEGKSNYWASG